MPKTIFRFYADKGNASPVLEWLDQQPEEVQEKMIVAMNIIEEKGHESRRPLWSPLRDGIFEIRVQHQNVHYRTLCFFHGRNVVIAAHGCTKERKVDPADIQRAICRMERFLKNPAAHTYVEVVSTPAKRSERRGGSKHNPSRKLGV